MFGIDWDAVVSKRPSEFEPADVLVGDSGNQAVITGDIYASNVMGGMWAVETEFGTLYLDEDLTYNVLPS